LGFTSFVFLVLPSLYWLDPKVISGRKMKDKEKEEREKMRAG